MDPRRARPELRASNDDRERTVELLRQHFQEGRLDQEELGGRIEQALSARTLGELARLTDDLPGPVPAPSPTPPAAAAAGSTRYGPLLGQYLLLNAGMIGIWALSGHGSFWPAWMLLLTGIAWGFRLIGVLERRQRHGIAALPRPRRRR
ncbi:MAG: DUF1707 domain-containing protein [Acidimicrobiales bacterium]